MVFSETMSNNNIFLDKHKNKYIKCDCDIQVLVKLLPCYQKIPTLQPYWLGRKYWKIGEKLLRTRKVIAEVKLCE